MRCCGSRHRVLREQFLQPCPLPSRGPVLLPQFSRGPGPSASSWGVLGALRGGRFPCGVRGQGSSQVAQCRWLLGGHRTGAAPVGGESPFWAGAEGRWWPAVYGAVLRHGVNSHIASGRSISDTSHGVLVPWAPLKPFLIFLLCLPTRTQRTVVATGGDGEGTLPL